MTPFPATTINPADTILGIPIWGLLLALLVLVLIGLTLILATVLKVLARRRQIHHGPGSMAAARLRRAGFTIEEFDAQRYLPVVIDGQAQTRTVVADLRLSRTEQRWVAVIGDADDPRCWHRALACSRAFVDHGVLIIAPTRPRMLEIRFPTAT